MDNVALLSSLYNIQTQYNAGVKALDSETARCIINSNSRAITIPDEIKFFGVQYDHRSKSVIFEIDRIVDDTDLATQTCVVQWINGDLATGNMGFFPVTSIDTSIPDKLIFEWEIYNESTQITGDLHFSIRFYSMIDEKTFLYSYNTLPAKSTILDTLDVQMTSTIEIKPSALEIWTERVSQLEIVARESIEVATRSALEAEAWAHGRNDYPNTILDNAMYYKDLTAAIYEEAKGSVELEKEIVVAEIADAKNQSISEIQAITDNSVRTAQQTGEEIEQNVLQYGVVQVSEMPPESDHVQVWIQPNQSEEYSLPEIKDDEVNEVDTWSSHKIKTELDKIGGSGATEEQIAQIEQNKNDISQLKGAFEELTKVNTITNTASGDSIVLTDSAECDLEILKVCGKSTQFSTTGAQLFDGVLEYADITENGYKIVARGSAPWASYNKDLDPSLFSGKTITVSCNKLTSTGSGSENGVQFAYKTSADATTSYVTLLKPNKFQGMFTFPDNLYSITFRILCNNSDVTLETPNEITIEGLMLVAGDEVLPWEPYTGGIPSPNPQYPQEITSAGDDGNVEVGVYGENLLPYPYVTKTATSNGVTFEESNGWITVSGSPTNIVADYTLFGENNPKGKCIYLPKGDYKIDLHPLNDDFSSENQFLAFRTLERGTILNSTIITRALKETELHVYHIFIRAGKEGKTYNNLILRPVVTLLSKELFTERREDDNKRITIPTPNGLPGIKVTDASLATYTDAEGQMWVADEIDFERGVNVQRIQKYTTIGNEKLTLSSNNRYAMNLNTHKLPPCVARYYDINCMSTHFKASGLGDMVSNTNSTAVESTHMYFYVDSEASEEDLLAILSQGVTIQYILATPIETPLSEEELTAYRALHSNYPTTTILNDSGANMEVKYKADTKNYIDNKFAELQTALIALGGI